MRRAAANGFAGKRRTDVALLGKQHDRRSIQPTGTRPGRKALPLAATAVAVAALAGRGLNLGRLMAGEFPLAAAAASGFEQGGGRSQRREQHDDGGKRDGARETAAPKRAFRAKRRR
jgi:hypothetical protein